MIEVKGAKEILRAIQGLPKQFSDPYLRKVHRKASLVVVNEIHRRAPVGLTGNLADSIGVVKSEGLGGIAVGPIIGGGKKGFAGHLNEYGTKPRRTRRGKKLGVMEAKPFERPAWDAKDSQVEQIIANELSRDLGTYFRQKL